MTEKILSLKARIQIFHGFVQSHLLFAHFFGGFLLQRRETSGAYKSQFCIITSNALLFMHKVKNFPQLLLSSIRKTIPENSPTFNSDDDSIPGIWFFRIYPHKKPTLRLKINNMKYYQGGPGPVWAKKWYRSLSR